MVAGG